MAPGDENEDEEEGEGGEAANDPEVIQVEITDELDLHTFLPRDVPSLIPDYLDECVRLGFREVRIVHGKGKGVLRRAVHAALDRHPMVDSYRQADGWAGSWGATLVLLRRVDP
ncbi:MAG TPA: Smr/MutS family protein [Kofleriaceae bacterium]|nr:Smr/MutS family protein [Kofleriaceae bacterium]